MELKGVQAEVHGWISQFDEGYWHPLAMLARLCEEVGELAREVNHRFGQKPKKPGEAEADLAAEMGDILFVLAAFANSLNIDLDAAFKVVMEKYRTRDAHRWTPKAAHTEAVEEGSPEPPPNVAQALLVERGVDLDQMAALVYELQAPYNSRLTKAACREALDAVLRKREVQYAVITGLTLDRMAERRALEEPLGSIIREDSRLYAIDEVLALAIVNIYGTIGLSNFGYLVEERPGCLAALGQRAGRVDTFLDDLIAAIVAATCARLAHNLGG